MRCNLALLFALVVGIIASADVAHSHAAVLDAEAAQAIRLHARYDTGAPMAHAQVIIYAPDDSEQAWGLGVADRDGRYEFIPDDIAGRWLVQVRHAGHGVSAHVEIGEDAPVLITFSAPDTLVQRALMVALVAWGALGTALYARSRKGRSDASA